MANSKQKPVVEGTKRSPGKSKFSIPRKEAPPIDGSYLDRLFADYEKQIQGIETGNDAAPARPSEVPEPPPVLKQPPSNVEETSASLSAAPKSHELLEQPKPPAPVPFPHKEPEPPAHKKLTTAASPVLPPAPAAPTPRTSAGLSQKQLTVAPPETIDDEAQLLEKWKKKHRLGKGEMKVLRVMLGLCRESGGDGCYIKVPQLMMAAELKERQTQLVLRSLRELGLIEKLTEYSNADRIGTKYRVSFDAD